jgi:hypothetical protein
LKKKEMTRELAKNTLSQINTPSNIPDNDVTTEQYEGTDFDDADPNHSLHPSRTGAKKLRRPDHNEIERKRRETQRDRIDELRQVLPGVSTSSRLSTVNVVIRAKEYIESLKKRVNELEGILAHYHPDIFKHSGKFFLNTSILPFESDGAVNPNSSSRALLAPKISAHPNIQPPNPPLSTQISFAQQLQSTDPSRDQGDEHKSSKKGKTDEQSPAVPIEEEEFLKKKIASFFHSQRASSTTIPGKLSSVPQTGRTAPGWGGASGLLTIAEVASSSDEHSKQDLSWRQNFFERRDSSLLFTSSSGEVFWNKRDSNSGSVGIMYPLEHNMHSDIRCGKCQRGLDNLIMIDCEKCKTWYHLRCVKIPPESIPLVWKCLECK